MPNLNNVKCRVIDCMRREARTQKEYARVFKKQTAHTLATGQAELTPIIENINNHCRFCYDGHLRAMKRKRILRLLLDRLKKLGQLGITIEELMENNPFPTKPFQRPEAKKFLEYAREGDKYKMRALLKICKYYVYEYDHVRSANQLNQTALHWAAKRGHLECVEILLGYGVDINAKDSMDKTALYYAFLGNYYMIVWVVGL